MEMHSPFPALRDFHLKVKRLTMICASLALLHPLLSLTHWIFGSLMLPYKSSSLVHPLLSLTHWIFRSLMLPYKSSSRSAKYVRWCDSCSLATPMQRAELNTARQSSHKSPARDDGAGGPPIVISTEAKRSGVEKSPPLMVRAALLWEISRLRVSWERFPSVSHTGTYLRSR